MDDCLAKASGVNPAQHPGPSSYSYAGEAKARFFRGLGFTRKRWGELADELLELVAKGQIVETIETPHGVKHVVYGPLRGTQVRTVWIIDPPGPGVRFVTAYPVRRRQ